MRSYNSLYGCVISLSVSFILCSPLLAAGGKATKTPAAKPVVKMAAYTESIPGTLVKFDMAPVPAGEVTVASKKVKIKPFWIGKTEVTWDEYDVYAMKLDLPESDRATPKDASSRPSKPYGAVDRGYGHKGYPVINVSYKGADGYCKWLSEKTGKKYRLATTAEWEYACRAGSPEPDEKKLDQFAWFWQEKTQPVGKKTPNAWGVCDMLGNVAEWCVDEKGQPVVCGGAYDDMAKYIKSTSRKYPTEDWQANDPQSPKSKWWLSDAPFVGFRVVCESK